MLTTPDEAFELMQTLPRCRGLSEEDISTWQSQVGVRGPESFRRLLAVTGQDMRWLFPEGLHQLEDVAQLRDDANELLGDAGADFRLTESDVVLEFYEGQGFAFFSCGQDDPEVVEWFEGQKQAKSSGRRLGVFVAAAIRRYLGRAKSDVAEK